MVEGHHIYIRLLAEFNQSIRGGSCTIESELPILWIEESQSRSMYEIWQGARSRTLGVCEESTTLFSLSWSLLEWAPMRQ